MRKKMGFFLAAWLILCLFVFFLSSGFSATLNCNTAQCVVIPFNNGNGGPNAPNQNCVIRPLAAYAYSDDLAENPCYGTDSQGGIQVLPWRNGFMLDVTPKKPADCALTPPTVSVSGTVAMVGNTSNRAFFATKCAPPVSK